MDITSACAAFIANLKFADIPAEARTWARAGLTDVVATTLGAADGEVANVLLKSGAVAGYRAPGNGAGGPASINGHVSRDSEAPIMGISGWAPATEAALAMGTLGHALDFDDVGGFGHPSTVLGPVIFALAPICHSSGEEAITAYIAGFEVGSRLADRNLFGRIDTSSHRRGQHPTSVFGAVGAAGTAARLLNLSAGQTAMALGIAASEGCGILRNFGTMTKPLHAGLAARAGVLAAELAAAGFTADPDALDGFLHALNPVLGEDEERRRVLMSNLGTEWELSRGLALKRYPACWSSHRAVTGLMELLAGAPLDLQQVDAIEVDLRETPLLRTSPTTGLEGKFSMAFNLAATAVKGALPVIDDYSSERIGNPAIQQAMHLVEHHRDASDEVVRIAIRRKDGDVAATEVHRAIGDPAFGLDESFIETKFATCARRALPDEASRALIARLAVLEACDDVCDLLALATPEDGPQIAPGRPTG